MKEIKWTGENRVIPNHGKVEKGTVKNLPDGIADSFVKQGLAKFTSKASESNRKVEENS